MGTVHTTTAGKLRPSIIGREVLINGIGVGKVSDFRIDRFGRVTIWGTRVGRRQFRQSAHVVY